MKDQNDGSILAGKAGDFVWVMKYEWKRKDLNFFKKINRKPVRFRELHQISKYQVLNLFCMNLFNYILIFNNFILYEYDYNKFIIA